MMAQKFTVHLERTNIYTAEITVEADNLADARFKAIEKARGLSRAGGAWEAEVGTPYVTKVVAHPTLKAAP